MKNRSNGPQEKPVARGSAKNWTESWSGKRNWNQLKEEESVDKGDDLAIIFPSDILPYVISRRG